MDGRYALLRNWRNTSSSYIKQITRTRGSRLFTASNFHAAFPFPPSPTPLRGGGGGSSRSQTKQRYASSPPSPTPSLEYLLFFVFSSNPRNAEEDCVAMVSAVKTIEPSYRQITRPGLYSALRLATCKLT